MRCRHWGGECLSVQAAVDRKRRVGGFSFSKAKNNPKACCYCRALSHKKKTLLLAPYYFSSPCLFRSVVRSIHCLGVDPNILSHPSTHRITPQPAHPARPPACTAPPSLSPLPPLLPPHRTYRLERTQRRFTFACAFGFTAGRGRSRVGRKASARQGRGRGPGSSAISGGCTRGPLGGEGGRRGVASGGQRGGGRWGGRAGQERDVRGLQAGVCFLNWPCRSRDRACRDKPRLSLDPADYFVAVPPP